MTTLGVFGPQYFVTCGGMKIVNNVTKAYILNQPYNVTQVITGDEPQGVCNQVRYTCKKNCMPYQEYKHCLYPSIELMVEKMIMNSDMFLLFTFFPESEIVDQAVNYAIKYNKSLSVVPLVNSSSNS